MVRRDPAYYTSFIQGRAQVTAAKSETAFVSRHKSATGVNSLIITTVYRLMLKGLQK